MFILERLIEILMGIVMLGSPLINIYLLAKDAKAKSQRTVIVAIGIVLYLLFLFLILFLYSVDT
jgi:hypothetical protein